MPRSSTPTALTFAGALDKMSQCTTSGELKALASGPEIGALFPSLSEDESRQLVEHYETLFQTLDTRIKLESIDGLRVTVQKAMVYPSKFGDCVVVEGRNGDKPYTFVTSAVRVLRHFEKNWSNLPADYIFTKDVHPKDPTKTMWTLRRISEGQAAFALPWEA